MVRPPTTQYAKTADGVNIAYQIWGEGPDLLLVPGFVSHLDLAWDSPGYAQLNERLGSFARVIAFDKRGTGMSDRPSDLPDADRRMLDMLAVLDAAESKRAAVLSISEGAAMAILFAATHPDRVSSLAVYGGYASVATGPDHPVGVPPEELGRFGEFLESRWGTGVGLSSWAPSIAADPSAREWFARFQRLGGSPGAARQLIASYNLIDVRSALELVQAPTLVLHRIHDRMIPIDLGREIAAGIPGARMVELPGTDHLLPTTNWRHIIDLVEEFVTGRVPEEQADRALATVLFTDIVDSTRQLARMGDERWRSVLESHEADARRSIARQGGRVVHGTGDGLLAVFDGPTRAIRAAIETSQEAREAGLPVRAGLHTGEIIRRADGDIAGLAVHIAARVADLAGSGEVLVSRTTADLVLGSGLRLTDAGEHELKGLDGSFRLFRADTALP